MSRDGRPRHVGDAVGEFFRRSGTVRSFRRAEAVLLWPRVCGPEVARFSSARTLRDGVLYVDVSDSETAMHLSMQRRRFLAVFHERYQANDVKEIRFQAGRPTAAGHTGRPTDSASSETEPPEPDHEALVRLVQEVDGLELSEDVSSAVLTAGRSLLKLQARQRAAGYVECATCGALHPGPLEPLTPREQALAGRDKSGYELPDRELCTACRRHKADPGVRKMAAELSAHPELETPLLSEPERGVALRLAAESLDAAMRTAFVEALADPRARETLAQLAQKRVKVATSQARLGVRLGPTSDPLDVLDPRYRRFLDLDPEARP
ncbi:MAG: DUF721 domain-containing protein [Trueperaceae bacterium]|nr:DUF721 domain-containing protein [Trueperaceae bacterium]